MPTFMLRITLQALAVAIPLFLIWIIGVIVAIARWKQDPRKAILTLLGIFLIAFVFLLEITWNTFGIRWINTNPSVFRLGRTLVIAIPLLLNLLKAGGWILILLAVFSKTKKTVEDKQEPQDLSETQETLKQQAQQNPQ